jgi:hypothetical protein
VDLRRVSLRLAQSDPLGAPILRAFCEGWDSIHPLVRVGLQLPDHPVLLGGLWDLDHGDLDHA